MKSNKKITRVQLKNSSGDEFIILGLVSSEPDYKMSLNINKRFKISLKNTLPVKLNKSGGEELVFSRFSDLTHSPEKVFSLISNRAEKTYLVKKLKNIDYVFIVHNQENDTDIDDLTARLREIESVNAVFNIDLNIFKDKNLQYLTQ